MRRHALPIGLGLLAVLLALGFRAWDPQLIRQARFAVFDLYQQIRPRTYEPAPVRVVDIDEESLAQLGQWPWPRTVVARLVDRLAALGAAAIAFDVVFAEPDRTSPGEVIGTWPADAVTDQVRQELAGLPEHDALLAASFARAPVVTGMVLINAPNDVEPLPRATFAAAGTGAAGLVPDYPGAIGNLPILEEAAAGNGSFSLGGGEQTGVIRRIPLIQSKDGQLYPTLALEALRVAQGARTIVTKASDASGEVAMGEGRGLVSVKAGRAEVPTTENGEFWVYYTETRPDRVVPVWQVLDPAADDAALMQRIAGQIVFIGTSAQGLLDLRTTPLNPFEPGVLIHAQAAEQMILGVFLERPFLADGAELVAIALLGLLLCFLLPRAGAVWSAVLAGAAIIAGVAASWLSFAEARLLFDPVYPSLSVLAVYLIVSLTMFLRAERERGRVRSAFSRYLAPALVDRLAEHPEQLVLGGEMRELTLMFSDIRGFTTIAEGMGPRDLTSLINSFLTPMTDIILESGGTIDKYMGDAIMAFWNAPLSDPVHARHAVQAALEMRRRLAGLNEEWRRQATEGGRPYRPIAIGIGINSGEVCVGNMGSEQRFDYSVLGDPVNLASRLESQSKLYGVDIVVSEATMAELGDMAALELDLIQVKGKKLPVRIFGLRGDGTLATSAAFQALRDTHDGMIAAYRAQRWDDAEAGLRRCTGAGDGELAVLYDLYARRISQYRAAPLPADWDGVYVAESK